ncbi:MAG: hypothetical protein Q3993_02795 [Filifactor alocis]|nr:hypothetical protein [Filifactor alocis]
MISIKTILYFYISVCACMILFNLVYMLRSTNSEFFEKNRKKMWSSLLESEFDHLLEHEEPSFFHKKIFHFLLKKIHHLSAFHSSMQEFQQSDPEEVKDYLLAYSPLFKKLALHYGRKDPMYRGYFAHIVGSLHVVSEDDPDEILTVLLSYLDSSTVYCREEVLNALYEIGHEGIVEQAILKINDLSIFHDPTILSKGLISFSGDKEVLCQKLWQHKNHLNRNLMIALIAFTDTVKQDYSEILYEILRDSNTDTLIKIEILNYFKTHDYSPIYPTLLDYIEQHQLYGEELALSAIEIARRIF